MLFMLAYNMLAVGISQFLVAYLENIMLRKKNNCIVLTHRCLFSRV